MGLGAWFGRLAVRSGERKVRACMRLQESQYKQLTARFPTLEPHEILANMWLSRRRFIDRQIRRMSNEERRVVALIVTLPFACLRPPDNAKALGIYCAHQEIPGVLTACPQFEEELKTLTEPFTNASMFGKVEPLYRSLNPQLAKDEVIANAISRESTLDFLAGFNRA